MPRFYFDSRDGEQFIRDDEGLEFADAEVARIEASAALAEMARDALPKSHRRELAIEVRDDTHHLFRLALWFEVEHVAS